MACNRSREIDDALNSLVAELPGVKIAFETEGRRTHRRVYFTYNGLTRFDVLTTTPSSGGILRAIVSQAKRTLRSMGVSFEDAEPVIKMKRPLREFEPLSPCPEGVGDTPRRVTSSLRLTLARALGLPEPTPVTERIHYSDYNSRRRRRRVRCWTRLGVA